MGGVKELDQVAREKSRERLKNVAEISWGRRLDRAEWSAITKEVYVEAYIDAYCQGLKDASTHLFQVAQANTNTK